MAAFKWSWRSEVTRTNSLPAKNTICLWYDHDAEEAARFYASVFPDSAIKAVHRAPSDNPSSKEGAVLTVEFTVLGIACLGLNGGPMYKHSQAFSFQVATADQAETDRYWHAIIDNGGHANACGWCQDKWGVSWANHADCLGAGVYRPGSRSREAHLRSNDDDDQNRHRRD